LLRRPALLGAALVLLVGAVAFVVVMSRSELRRTATNSRVFPTYVDVPPEGEVCAPLHHVPAGTGHVMLLMGTEGVQRGGPLAVTLRQGRRVVASGRSRGGYGDEAVFIKITAIERTLDPVTLCARNTGTTKVEMYGDYQNGGAAQAMTSFAGPQPVALRVDWFGTKPQSWWQTVGPVADRFGLVKPPFFGNWTFWATLALLLAISAAAVRTVVREPRP
jgi:hypothetical protein